MTKNQPQTILLEKVITVDFNNAHHSLGKSLFKLSCCILALVLFFQHQQEIQSSPLASLFHGGLDKNNPINLQETI